MNYLIEKYFPIVLAIISLPIIYFIDNNFLNKINFTNLINSTLIVFSVLLGFLLTVSTLLHTIENKKMLLIKKTNAYPRLIKYLQKAIYFSLGISFLSLIIPLLKNIDINFSIININFRLIFKTIYLFILLLTAFYTIRFINIFLKIISEESN